MTEKFSLRWNEFHSNVSKSFGLFRNEEYLHDVTLISDDNNRLQANKLVLSACSEYFRDILKYNQQSHPLLCLDGMSFEDLENTMDFIYNGEVQIHQEKLDRFLSIAQRLKLEGLIGNTKDELNQSRNDVKLEDVEHEESFYLKQIESPKNKTIAPAVMYDIENADQIKEKITEYLEECLDGGFRCILCGKMSNINANKADQRKTIRRHIETHLEGLTYTCPICQKITRDFLGKLLDFLLRSTHFLPSIFDG